MDIAPTQSSNPLVAQALTKNSKESGQTLSSQDFLQLLTVQLTNQDPLNPMEDTEFISQMANFTSLEQMNELTQSFQTYSNSQQEIASQAYLGKHVTLNLADSESASGLVTAVTKDETGQMTVTVNGKEYGINQIQSVALPPSGKEVTES